MPTTNSTIESIRRIFGPQWRPAPTFTKKLQDRGIYGAVRIAGRPEVYTLGPGGTLETPESFKQKFGTLQQEGIVGIVTPEQAGQLGVQVSPIGQPAPRELPREIERPRELPREIERPSERILPPEPTTPIPSAPIPEIPQSTGNSALDETLKVLENYLKEIQKRGQVVNPNIEITPERLAEFTKQAETEIDPYYRTSLSLAREDLFRELGYSRENILQAEQELERQYGKTVRRIGEEAAETGFALSGRRLEQEAELAQATQRQLEGSRRQAQFAAGTAGRTFAREFGGLQGEGLPTTPTLPETPRALPGEATFAKGTRELPFYELSPDIYSQLTGEREFERRGAIRERQAELERAERERLLTGQIRTLTL